MTEDYSDLTEPKNTSDKNVGSVKGEPSPRGSKVVWLDTFYNYHKQIGLLLLVFGFVVGFAGVYVGSWLYGVALVLLVVGGVMLFMDELLLTRS